LYTEPTAVWRPHQSFYWISYYCHFWWRDL